MKIYKTSLPSDFDEEIIVQSHAKSIEEFKNTILKIDEQHGSGSGPVMWYFFDDGCSESDLSSFNIFPIGTGWSIDPDIQDQYIGTIDMGFVYHYFVELV